LGWVFGLARPEASALKVHKNARISTSEGGGKQVIMNVGRAFAFQPTNPLQ
jgi:hypothetical protein